MEVYQNVTTTSQFDAVIVANGNFPSHNIPMEILRNAKFIVCCDGAAIATINHGIMPDAVVGDGDSLPTDVKQKFGNKLHIVSEQDFNDLTKATRFVLSSLPNAKTIAYLGATGKREDHTLGNIALLPFYVQEFGICPVMITDYGYFVVTTGNHCFSTFPHQQVSIFNLTCNNLLGRGFKWAPYAFKQLWQGTLNEALDTEVEIKADGMYAVFRNFRE